MPLFKLYPFLLLEDLVFGSKVSSAVVELGSVNTGSSRKGRGLIELVDAHKVIGAKKDIL